MSAAYPRYFIHLFRGQFYQRVHSVDRNWGEWPAAYYNTTVCSCCCHWADMEYQVHGMRISGTGAGWLDGQLISWKKDLSWVLEIRCLVFRRRFRRKTVVEERWLTAAGHKTIWIIFGFEWVVCSEFLIWGVTESTKFLTRVNGSGRNVWLSAFCVWGECFLERGL